MEPSDPHVAARGIESVKAPPGALEQIDMALETQSRAVSDLERELTDFTAKIDPILRAEPPAQPLAAIADERPPSSALASRCYGIDQITDRIRWFRECLERLGARVDL